MLFHGFINSSMQFNENYYIRNEKMKNLQVPSISEAKQQLGDNLAAVFFKSCPQSLNEDMSISSVLKGPGVELWMSPSDILVNKVVLKPPLTNKHIRALTHEGILDIGLDIEMKLLRELEAVKQKEIHDQSDVLRCLAERDKDRAVTDALMREHELFKLKLMQLNGEFETLLQNEIMLLEVHLREMYEKMFEARIKDLMDEQEEDTVKRIEEATSEGIQTLTMKFLEDLKVQECQLTKIFEMKLEGQQEKYKTLLKNEQDVFEIILKQLKHNLQCNNIANLMYVLCSERRKCLQEKQMLVNTYDKQIDYLNETINSGEDIINELILEKNEKQRQLDIREECLLKVICQFQKFINYALRATPTQAEFLLSVEKMLVFELTQAVAQAGYKKHLCKQLMPWRTESKKNESIFDNDMEPPDYHNCLKELPMSRGIEREPEESPSIVKYNEHVYVREDFRNQISQGLRLQTSNMIWNNDIENLFDILRRSVTTDVEPGISPTRSPTSSVHFDDNNSELLLKQDSTNIGLLAAQDSFDLQKSIKSRVSEQDDDPMQQYTAVALLAVLDSLTTLKNLNLLRKNEELGESEESYKVSKSEQYTYSNETIKLSTPKQKSNQKIRDSLALHESDQIINLGEAQKKVANEVVNIEVSPIMVKVSGAKRKNKNVPVKKEINKKHLSKLSFHRDSLELVRQEFDIDSSRQVRGVVRASADSKRSKSHLVVNIPKIAKKVDINFEQVASLYKDLIKQDKPWKIYQEPTTKKPPQNYASNDHFLCKPNEAKVLGQSGNNHVQSSKEFTIHRIHSIIDILKKDDSLIRMFTGCGQ